MPKGKKTEKNPPPVSLPAENPPAPPPPSPPQMEVLDWETVRAEMKERLSFPWGMVLASMWKLKSGRNHHPPTGSTLAIRWDSDQSITFYGGGPEDPPPIRHTWAQSHHQYRHGIGAAHHRKARLQHHHHLLGRSIYGAEAHPGVSDLTRQHQEAERQNQHRTE
ncbi:hypothetical protein BDZ91DRAFT_797813 [Kalaharituber pfeilii]|nr:hypothetical protein BDZ91DRAFT_797813 [Kalaharituber pfeilii]